MTDQVRMLQYKYETMYGRLSGEINLLNGRIKSMGDCREIENHMKEQVEHHQREVLSESNLNDEDKMTASNSSLAGSSENAALMSSKDDMLVVSHYTNNNQEFQSLRGKHGELLELFKETIYENKRLITVNEQQRNIIKNLTAQYEDLLFSKPCLEEIEEY